MRGNALSAADSASITTELARLTGLSGTYIRETNMRVNIFRFCKELLRDQRRTVGRLDSRFTGIDQDAAGESFDYDPSMSNIMGPFSSMLNDYVRRELKYQTDLPYEILTGKVQPWSFKNYENRFLYVEETLRQAMTTNPALRVWVACGYYDLATPYFATDYTFSHLGLDPSLESHVTRHYYEAGHMMYIHAPSLAKMKTDMTEFLATSAP
jgi:carboxypeptidase C (cathepsin A)